MYFKRLISLFAAATLLFAIPAYAETKTKTKTKTYDEDTIIRLVSNKSKKQVIDLLGEPASKQMSVKPSNAERVIGRPLDKSGKPDNVEMWYYTNLVRYDAKRTYKTTELTFVNGRCSNLAFFNTK